MTDDRYEALCQRLNTLFLAVNRGDDGWAIAGALRFHAALLAELHVMQQQTDALAQELREAVAEMWTLQRRVALLETPYFGRRPGRDA